MILLLRVKSRGGWGSAPFGRYADAPRARHSPVRTALYIGRATRQNAQRIGGTAR
ncbi:hypothetical protein GZL_03025 [Streptomyces sp. 769]|nr:hypothetical protein GZL_03025 [Streptomyces sp. 769]